MELATILALVIGILVIPALSWYLTRKRELSVTFRLIDFSYLTFFTGLLLSRLFGLIYNSASLTSDWSVLPITQPGEEIEYFAELPWALLNITDGNFLLMELASGFVLAHFVFALFNGRRVSFRKISEQRYLAFAVSSIAIVPLGLAAVYNGYLENQFDPHWPVMFVLLNLLGFLAMLNLYTSRNAARLLVILAQLFPIIILSLTAISSEKNLEGVNALAGILLIISTIFFFTEFNSEREAPQPKRQYRNTAGEQEAWS